MISEFRVFSYKKGVLITDGVKVSSCRHVSVVRPPSQHAMLWRLHTLYIDVLPNKIAKSKLDVWEQLTLFLITTFTREERIDVWVPQDNSYCKFIPLVSKT